jgi:hypothetical protein
MSMIKSAAGAIASFVVGGLAVVLVREPFSYDVLPNILQTWFHGQKMELFVPDGNGDVKLDSTYSIYAARLGTGESFGGRLVVRSEDGKDTDRQSHLSGLKRNDIMVFNYSPVITDHIGGGNFVGRRDRDRDAYVGNVVGFHKKKGESECVMRRFIAVVADDRQTDIAELARKMLPSYVEWSPSDPSKQVKYSCGSSKPAQQATPKRTSER